MNSSMETKSASLNHRLLDLALPVRTGLGLAAGAGFLGGLLVIAQAGALSQVIDRVFLGGQGLSQVAPLLELMVGIIFGRALLSFLGDGLAGSAAIQIKTGLRELLFRHIFDLGPAFTQSQTSGDLAARAIQGVEALEAYFGQYLPQVILAAVIPLSILVVVFPMDLLSGVVLLLTAPLIPLFMYLIGSYAEGLTRRQFSSLSRMSAVFLDTLQGLAALKALNQSLGRVEKIRQASEDYRAATLGVLRITFLSALVLELVGTISTAVVAVEVGLRLLYGQLNFGQAFFILVIAPEFYQPLRQLGLRFHAATAGISAARAIFEVLDRQKPAPLKPEKTKPQENPVLAHPLLPTEELGLTFEGVTYQYPDRETEALNGVTFSIPAGQLTALAGASGSGKSTLAQLILRFIEPQAGDIRVNGRGLESIPIQEWRRLVSWVPQQPVLFQGSLGSNIQLARPGASEAEIRRAASLAGLDDFIQSLPESYATRVGERAGRLSGGQVQRLALARAFLKDAPLLILDEPAANLDFETGAQLQAAIQLLCQGRTVLLIAHQLQSLTSAGQIVVLEKGQVVERGSHPALMEQGGIYARLYQQGGWLV